MRLGRFRASLSSLRVLSISATRVAGVTRPFAQAAISRFRSRRRTFNLGLDIFGLVGLASLYGRLRRESAL